MEIPLLGGDVTDGLVRVGDTVRRPPSHVSPAVAMLLRELESVGFDRAPRHLGIDERGRHILTFIDGTVAGRPWPEWVALEESAVSVAHLVRAYDDAAARVGVPAWAQELVPIEPAGIPASAATAPTLIGHMDITPENVVFAEGESLALIDFDLARPATPVEEVCNLLQWWGAWMPPEDREAVMRDVDHLTHGRRIVDAYGLSAADRATIVDVFSNEVARVWHLMRWRSEHLGGGWRRMWEAGVGDRIVRRKAWVRDQASALRRAVEG